MTAYYNENDPKAAAWLRELIKAGHIAPGIVDERDIRDVRADDLAEYAQCHFFAGIGGWSYALRLAGWPDERPVWTGSCPCQPFSIAGSGKGIADERHLWPTFAALIRAGRPPIVFGEQVASAAGRQWLSGVFADLEGMDYCRAAADLCAPSVGAPHIRQRLWWMAYAADSNGRGGISRTETATWPESIRGGRLASGSTIGGMADPECGRGYGRDEQRSGARRRKVAEQKDRSHSANESSNGCENASGLDLSNRHGGAPRVSGPVARQKRHARVIDDSGDQKYATGGGAEPRNYLAGSRQAPGIGRTARA